MSARALDVVKYLIDERQIDPSCRDEEGDTALHYAALGGQLEVAKYLIMAKNSDPMCENNLGTTPYAIAISEGHLELVKFFSKVVSVQEEEEEEPQPPEPFEWTEDCTADTVPCRLLAHSACV